MVVVEHLQRGAQRQILAPVVRGWQVLIAGGEGQEDIAAGVFDTISRPAFLRALRTRTQPGGSCYAECAHDTLFVAAGKACDRPRSGRKISRPAFLRALRTRTQPGGSCYTECAHDMLFVAAGEACDRPRSGRKTRQLRYQGQPFCERYALERSLAAAATRSVRMTRFS
jgi:hypothetical protein